MIVAVVAVISETNPLELPSLQSVLDAKVVERLVEVSITGPSNGDVHMSFTYTDYHVTVHSYGLIAVQPLHEDSTD